MYFSSLQYLAYPKIGEPLDTILTTNIFKRVILRQDLLADSSNYYEHTMSDGETLEILADKIYGDPYFYWIILYINNLLDPLWDMPLDDESFGNYIVDKYDSVQDAKDERDPISATYGISGTLLTVTTYPTAHNFSDGRKCYLDFGDSNLLNGIYVVDVTSSTAFEVTLSESTSGSGTLSVSPPHLIYYMKNYIADEDFYETDKETYDAISESTLKSTRSAWVEESAINNNKRIIKMLKPQFLQNVVSRFQEELQS